MKSAPLLLCAISAVLFTAPAFAQTAPVGSFDQVEARATTLRANARGFSGITALPDFSPAGVVATMDAHRAIIAEIDAIDRSALPYPRQVTLEVMRWDSERVLAREPYLWLQFPYTPYEYTFSGPNRGLTSFPFASDADIDAYLQLARAHSDSIDSLRSFVVAQRQHGVLASRSVAEQVRAMFLADAKPPEQSFAWPSDTRLSALTSAGRTRLRSSLRQIISGETNPALRRLSAVFGSSYQRQAPTTYGLAQYQGGAEYYRVLVRERLTLDIAPEDLFARSQQALDQIGVELAALRAEMGHTGPRQTFDQSLMRDPRFIARSTDEVEARYLEYMSRIDAHAPEMFCRPAPYGYAVRRASPEQEAALTYGMATTETTPTPLGVYIYNGSNLGQRPLLPAQALIYHELFPGHYWDAAMESISTQLTSYPRANMAFAEGWGDFAQVLAYEQGVFRTPEERYGRLTFVEWFHARALADVGLNYFGRDITWAETVLAAHSLESPTQNRRSIIRDSSDWQAQILPYTYGSGELLRLRERARIALGARFDQRRFYDAVLMTGGLPFPVLERHVDAFIEAERAGGMPGVCS